MTTTTTTTMDDNQTDALHKITHSVYNTFVNDESKIIGYSFELASCDFCIDICI